MVETHNFLDSKEKGDEGQEAIKPVLDEEYMFVIDVTEQQEFYEPDIDYICIDEDLNNEYVELKTDTYAADSNALFIETWSNKENETPGWYYDCKADWIYYYAIPTTLYKFKLREMRDWLGDPEEREFGESKYVQNRGYSSRGVVVPLERIPERLYEEHEMPQEQ